MSYKLLRSFEFAGRMSGDYGAYISKPPSFPLGRRKVESFPVPGRNGPVHVDTGSFEDPAPLELECLVKGDHTTGDALTAWLDSGAGKPQPLKLSCWPGVYFEALPLEIGALEPILNSFYRWRVTFQLRPQKFVDTPVLDYRMPDEFEDPEPTWSTSFVNPGTQVALPLIRLDVRGADPVTVRVSAFSGDDAESYRSTDLTLTDITGSVILDAETGEAYNAEGDPVNDRIAYPEAHGQPVPLRMPPGRNGLTIRFYDQAPTLDRVRITGRWWNP